MLINYLFFLKSIYFLFKSLTIFLFVVRWINLRLGFALSLKRYRDKKDKNICKQPTIFSWFERGISHRGDENNPRLQQWGILKQYVITWLSELMIMNKTIMSCKVFTSVKMMILNLNRSYGQYMCQPAAVIHE